MQVKLYGIAGCDKVRAARSWLAQYQIDTQVHDFKCQGVSAALLAGWLRQIDWSELINRRGTADRKSSIAAFVCVAWEFVAVHPRHPGSIALLLPA